MILVSPPAERFCVMTATATFELGLEAVVIGVNQLKYPNYDNPIMFGESFFF